MATLTTKAQNIPNGNFEKGYNLVDSTIPNWSPFGSLTIGTNDSTLTDGPLFSLSTQSHSGNYALEIRTLYNVTQNTQNELEIGCDSNTAFFAMPTFHINNKPYNLSFYSQIKQLPLNSFLDSTICKVSIFNSDYFEIGYGETKLWTKSSSYLFNSLPILYLPDSSITQGDSIPAFAFIRFKNKNSTDTPHVGHRILIDDLNFDFTPSSIQNKIQINKLSIFPNPIFDEFQIVNYAVAKNASISIVNLIGQPVFEKNIYKNDALKFNIKKLPTGTYIVLLKEENKIYQTKIIKE